MPQNNRLKFIILHIYFCFFSWYRKKHTNKRINWASTTVNNLSCVCWQNSKLWLGKELCTAGVSWFCFSRKVASYSNHCSLLIYKIFIDKKKHVVKALVRESDFSIVKKSCGTEYKCLERRKKKKNPEWIIDQRFNEAWLCKRYELINK